MLVGRLEVRPELLVRLFVVLLDHFFVDDATTLDVIRETDSLAWIGGKLLTHRWQRPDGFVDRSKRIMIPLFRWATIGSMTVLLFGILSGLTASGEVDPRVQIGFGVFVMLVLVVAVSREVPGLSLMHDLLADMEESLPAERPAAPSSAGAYGGSVEGPDAPNQRARALVYVGSTVLTMLLGYRYISGVDLPPVSCEETQPLAPSRRTSWAPASASACTVAVLVNPVHHWTSTEVAGPNASRYRLTSCAAAS